MNKLILCVCALMASRIVFAAEPSIAVTATPRYPWSGMVDLDFTITGDSGTKYDTLFKALDVEGNEALPMKTVYKSDGSRASATESLLPGTYRWSWDAKSDVEEDLIKSSGCLSTASAVVYENRQLSLVTEFSAIPCGKAISDKTQRVKGTWVKADGNGMEVQFAAADDKFTKCVCAHFEQQGSDIVANIKWAKYVDGTDSTAKDFNAISATSQTIATSEDASGYGLRSVAIKTSDYKMPFCCERVSVVGEVKEKYPMDSGNGTTFIPGTYLILNLNTFSIETRDNVTSASEFNTDTFRQTKMVFRKIPAGSFMMQQNGATPAVKVTLVKDFYMSIFECTITQYRKLGGNFDYDNMVPAYASWNTLAGKNGIISKFNAKLSATGYQANLPCEAQWERAARAGSTSACYFNSVKGSLGNYAWYTDNAVWEIRKPGLKLPNAWGLYDMYGNSDEWCLDLYDSWDKVAAKQPGGPNSSSYASRVLRGGTYCCASYCCSSIYRNACDPSAGDSAMGNHDTGFRFVLVAK